MYDDAQNTDRKYFHTMYWGKNSILRFDIIYIRVHKLHTVKLVQNFQIEIGMNRSYNT